MTRYFETSKEFGPGITFDLQKEFGDLELFGTLMQFKSMQKEFWERVGNGGSVTASPLIYRGAIYFGAHDKRFYCLDMDGREKWHYDADGNIMKWAVEGGGLIYFGSFDGAVYALDTKGKLAWKFETQGPILDNPMFHDGRVYCGSGDGNVYCIDAKTGKEIWKFTTGDLQTAVLFHRNRFFFGYADNTFYCLDLNGKFLWRFRVPNMICAWPADALGDMVYFGCYDKNAYALNLRGELIWRFETGNVAYPPRAEGNRVFVGSRDNHLYCLDPKTGRKIWKFKTGGFVSFMILHRGVVYFGSYDHNMYAVDFNTGKELWRFRTGGFVTYVAAHGERIYFGSWDCNLYCLDLEGRLVWKFPTSMQTPASIEPPEATESRTVEFVLESKEKKAEKKEGESQETGSYGEFSGNYLNISIGEGPELGYKTKKKYGQ